MASLYQSYEKCHYNRKEYRRNSSRALNRTRKLEQIDAKTPLTYAGRLDPMAEGVLIILVGDECKKKQKYLGLDKEYEIEVLFGLETDTQDILGVIKRIDIDNVQRIPGRKNPEIKSQ